MDREDHATHERKRRAFIWLPGSDSAEVREHPLLIGLLNEFGAQGWELVGEHTAGSNAFQGRLSDKTGKWLSATSYPVQIVWTFKRRAREP